MHLICCLPLAGSI